MTNLRPSYPHAIVSPNGTPRSSDRVAHAESQELLAVPAACSGQLAFPQYAVSTRIPGDQIDERVPILKGGPKPQEIVSVGSSDAQADEIDVGPHRAPPESEYRANLGIREAEKEKFEHFAKSPA